MENPEGKFWERAETDLSRILNKDQFLYFLDLEVKRGQRYQNFISVLILELIPLSNGYGADDLQSSYRALATLVMEEMREADIFGSLGQNRLGILLPYADLLAGAHAKSRFESILKYYDFRAKGYDVGIRQVCFPVDGTNAPDLMKKLIGT